MGIVTRSDLLAVAGREKNSRRGSDRTVGDIMTRRVITVAPDETLERAARLMLQKKISGLPVVGEGGLEGIVTESDVFRALGEMLGVESSDARIVLTARDDEDILRKVSEHLDGLKLSSLTTWHNRAQKRWEIVMRVRGGGSP